MALCQLKMRDRTKPITGHMQVTCLVIIASELENIKDIHCYIVFLFANNTYSIALIFNYAFRSHILQVCWMCQHMPPGQGLLLQWKKTLKKLSQSAFEAILLRRERSYILFATRINHRLETYVSAVPDSKLKRWMSCQSLGSKICHFINSIQISWHGSTEDHNR